jgi:glycosyltransferase involved in cell wall biosynthesis
VKLVFVTQQVDPRHPVLGATVAKLAALAAVADEVVVLTDAGDPGALPPNCRIRPFRSRLRAGRGVRFALALARELAARPRPAAVVAHMCPIYAVLAAPLARPLRVPVLLWFTHPRASTLLRLAERLSTRVLTVDPGSFPIRSDKVRAIGHGIDVERFACLPPRPGEGLRLLALGRTSAVKRLPLAVEAVRRARAVGVDVELRIVGGGTTAGERAHEAELERLAGDGITLEAPVPYDAVPALLAESDALVSATDAGSADKAAFEAAASCRLVLASSPALAQLVPPELRFDSAARLAGLLAELVAMPAGERAAVARRLRERVEREHSAGSWARSVVEAAR